MFCSIDEDIIWYNLDIIVFMHNYHLQLLLHNYHTRLLHITITLSYPPQLSLIVITIPHNYHS